jgi:hypothetical protein
MRPQRLQIADGHEELYVLKRGRIEQIVDGLRSSRAGRNQHRENEDTRDN